MTEEAGSNAAKNPAAQRSRPVKTPPMPLHATHNPESGRRRRGRYREEPLDRNSPHEAGRDGHRCDSRSKYRRENPTPHGERATPHSVTKAPMVVDEGVIITVRVRAPRHGMFDGTGPRRGRFDGRNATGWRGSDECRQVTPPPHAKPKEIEESLIAKTS